MLHAAWVPPLGEGKHQLALWAEAQSHAKLARRTTPTTLAASAAAPRPRAHPFAAKTEELAVALEQLWRVARPGVRPRTAAEPRRLTLWLPALGSRPLSSPEATQAGWAPNQAAALGDDLALLPLALWRVDSLLLDAESAGTLLASLPQQPGLEIILPTAVDQPDDEPPPRIIPGNDLRLWGAAATFALDLVVRQRFMPGVMLLPEQEYLSSYSSGPRVASFWFAALDERDDHQRFESLIAQTPDLCRAAVPFGMRDPTPESASIARALLEDFLHHVVSAFVTKALKHEKLAPAVARGSERERDGYRYYGYPTSTSLTQRWLDGLAAPAHHLYASTPEVRALTEGFAQWHGKLAEARRTPFRLCLRLAPPAEPEDAEDGADAEGATEATAAVDMAYEAATPEHSQNGATTNGDPNEPAPSGSPFAAVGAWRLDYLLQARDDPSLLVSLEEVWRERGAIAAFLNRRFERPHERVLTSLGQAARIFAPIERSLRQAHPLGCDLSGDEAYAFLSEALPALEEAGFGVQVPTWWARARAKPTLRLSLSGLPKTSSGLMGLDAVVAYDWKVALGETELTREELEALVALKEPLVRLRGQWVELRRDDVEATLRFVARHSRGRMSLGEALRASLTGEVGDGELHIEQVNADEWISELLDKMQGGEALAAVAPPQTLHGTLRPYQGRGLAWLDFLTRYGLGACLADDMGLGKTVQLLALLLHQKAGGQLTRPVLLICPTSVVGNWEHEAARFAPDLRVLIHHGGGRLGRADGERFVGEVAGYDLVVTTYSLVPRDEATLARVEWGGVVLDEAQNIKNVEAKQSRAVRRLQAPLRVALTGTPVENRLAELWSIIDFLNPGYLGSHTRFHERFALPIERQHDQQATERLQALVRPFVLRRLKTDPTVISDLPEKIEMREYCPLTREQVTLYEAVVRDGLRQIEAAQSPMERRGIVLALLVRLKQVCNHPAHFLGDGSALARRSGKLTRLEELIEELLAEGDRALIFTQFTAMGDRLQPYLRERFGTDVLYLHGGVPRTQREQLVARFQANDGPPLFLLSLKAGGTGLNLTHANHVIHFDRWWNPAVENQATDRAFRIGQVRNVQVRKFVCSGTLEERIDALIEQKRDLAEQVVGAGEGWLTEMSTGQLRDLFSLRTDAFAD